MGDQDCYDYNETHTNSFWRLRFTGGAILCCDTIVFLIVKVFSGINILSVLEKIMGFPYGGVVFIALFTLVRAKILDNFIRNHNIDLDFRDRVFYVLMAVAMVGLFLYYFIHRW